MQRARFALLVLLALLAPACFRPRTQDPDAEPPRIEVRNRYLGPVVIYVATGSNSVRLGMIQSNQTLTFNFPVGVNPYSTGIRLVVDPIGDFEGYRSDSITANSGTTIVLTVENELRHSYVVVR